MNFLPRTLGTRPRLACEVRAEGVVAARGEDASAVLAAVSRVALEDPTTISRLRAGAVAPVTEGVGAPSKMTVGERAEVVDALRKALEAVAMRTREVTLVVPDAAVRVLLLDFDALPGKAEEALPIVRFRLKKLLPFDADDAAVSYQVMSSAKGMVSVVAVAMPREVLAEYEGLVRAAGFEPGAVLPSTLAALAGLTEEDAPVLVVNAGMQGVTTAIVRGGVLLLHRTVDLAQVLLADAGAEGPAAVAAMDVATGRVEVALLEPEVAAERRIVAATREVAQAVSVAAAYFEDTLEATPGGLLATGTMGAEMLAALLGSAGVGPVRVEEMVSPEMFGAGAASAAGRVPPGWLAGVRGALTS